jgi:RNA polymerase sigma factor (sigma-70 family)
LQDHEHISSLVRSAQQGDELAFTELVGIFQDLVVAYATSILGNFALAQDAAQEAFVDAHRQLSTLREPLAFSAWLRTIVFKHCDRLTRRRRHPTTDLTAAEDIPSAQPTPQDILESRSIELLVHDTIDSLPDDERIVVTLYYMGEQSHAAIAQFLGVTSNTVKTRLYSARRRMKDHLANSVVSSLRAIRPSQNSQFTRRVLNAMLPVQVFSVDEHGAKHAVGSTVADRQPEIPNDPIWFIEPRQALTAKNWELILDLATRLRIPGLAVPGQVTNEQLERISRLDHLKYLDIRDSASVNDEGMRHLSRLQRLEQLDLSGTSITDRGLAVLRDLTQLKAFEVRHHGGVSDEGVSHLIGCDLLERVNLMGTSTGDGAVEALAGKPQLREFFAGNRITDDGIGLFHQFPMFKNWRRCKSALSLLSFGGQPNHLWLNLAAPFTNKGLNSLSGLDGLYALDLFGSAGCAPFDSASSAVTIAGLASLTSLSNLRWLGCCSELCTDEALLQISRMRGLLFLLCQDAVAGDEGFAVLKGSASIEYIWGRRCYNLTGKGFVALSQMPALRGLAVSCRNVDDDALSSLPDFPALSEFMPIDVPDRGFRHIGGCTHLHSLHCMYCPEMTDEAVLHLTRLQRLKSFNVWGTHITDRTPPILANIKSIESLRFYKCDGITDAGLSFLAALARLRQIDLEFLPNVTADAALVFGENVRVNYLPSMKGQRNA